MEEKTPILTSAGETHQTGYAFVSSMLEPFYTSDADAENIYQHAESVYIAGPVTQTTNLVVTGQPTIEVFDENGDPVEDVSRDINAMLEKAGCNLYAAQRAAMKDMMIWGTSPFNWVWERENGKLVLKALNHIHPYNFAKAPSGMTNRITNGRLLRGIVYDRLERKLRYYHRQDAGAPQEISDEDLLIVKDSASDYPDGKSIVYPMIKYIELSEYALNALGQQLYRTAAPIIFIKITDPKPERVVNGVRIQSDVDFAKEVESHWGKDTNYTLRENMELIKFDVSEGSLSIKAIDFLQNTLRDYLNPNGMLGKDGALISGNSDASLRLLNNSITGWISLLETAFNAIPQHYLKYNGYPDSYTSKVTIPHTVIEDWSRKLQIAQIGFNTKTLTPNEVRELLGREGLSDEELAKISADWQTIAPPAPASPEYDPMAMFANSSVSRGARSKRNAIAAKAIGEMEDATDELERAIHAALRNELK